MSEPKTFVRVLPENLPVRLSVEKVYKRSEDDSSFSLECRICDGTQVGNLISIYFFRFRKDGAPTRQATDIFTTLFPDKDPADISSYMFEGKIFECRPWQPENSKYQAFSNFKYIGNNDVF